MFPPLAPLYSKSSGVSNPDKIKMGLIKVLLMFGLLLAMGEAGQKSELYRTIYCNEADCSDESHNDLLEGKYTCGYLEEDDRNEPMSKCTAKCIGRTISPEDETKCFCELCKQGAKRGFCEKTGDDFGKAISGDECESTVCKGIGSSNMKWHGVRNCKHE